jgi:hypothetical protein
MDNMVKPAKSHNRIAISDSITINAGTIDPNEK